MQYYQIEKEALGIIFAVTKFHRYLHGRQFIRQVDHKPLITIFGSKKGLPVYTANRLLRWGKIILNCNFKIEFLTSKNICHADSLSQLIPKNTEVFEDAIIAKLRTNLFRTCSRLHVAFFEQVLAATLPILDTLFCNFRLDIYLTSKPCSVFSFCVLTLGLYQ